MSREHFRRATDLFERARALSPADRESLLATECASDPALRAEVESLLAFHGAASGFLVDSPVPPESVGAGDTAAGDPSPLPARIDHYRIVDTLGEGGMGIVYLAEQQAPVKRRVALKLIKLGMDTREVVARFDAERQALALLDHPGIARVFDAGSTAQGRPYFVMEYVDGVALTEYCDRNTLSLHKRLELFCQVCEAVEHAHRHGIIHRDLKPSNILVTARDGHPIVKIIDFGIARATDHRLAKQTIYTELGRVVGTPAYMSPEQADPAHGAIDHRVDVYSLGATLYELLVGELPIEPEALKKATFDEVIRRIREDDPPTPGTRWTRLNAECADEYARRRETTREALRSALRGDLDWITMKALEKRRARRYSSAAELAADVVRHLNNEAVEAAPPSVLYRVQRYVRRNRVQVTAALLVVLVLITGSGVFLVLQQSKNDELAAQNARILRLADVKRLEDRLREADQLWPCVPEKAERMARWLGKATELAGRRSIHERTLAELRATAIATSTDPPAWSFADEETEWQHATLASLVDGIGKLTAVIADVETRLEFATTVRERSIISQRGAWADAIRSITDEKECPKYGGLRIREQLGLVPIGRDPRSDLWEFAHIQSGEIPKRDTKGKLILSDGMGVVFILLPGGTFRMGAVRASPKRPASDPNVDPDALYWMESPVHDVTLAPFFMSKFEFTQGQWMRTMHSNPSGFSGRKRKKKIRALQPVERVSWPMCRETLRRLDLEIPTEAQWEYAARAGTSSAWWTGNDRESLVGKLNIADAKAKRFNHRWPAIEEWPEFDDGHIGPVRVAKFPANPWGLHGVLGNVSEWTRDWTENYKRGVRDGDGLRVAPVAPGVKVPTTSDSTRIRRGSSFRESFMLARSASRVKEMPEVQLPTIGVRPSRALRN